MKTLNSKLIFAALQLLDIATTITTIHYGFPEGNPITAHLIVLFGVVGGLIASKAIACAVMVQVKSLRWVANVAYIFIVTWNLFIISVVSFVKAFS